MLQKKIKLNCLTSKDAIQQVRSGNYEIPKLKNLTINLTEWSLEQMIRKGGEADFIFLPSDITHPKRMHVSNNRLITAFSFNKPVIATSLESYKMYSEYFIDFDSIEAIDYFLKNKVKKINYKEVVDNYKFEKISLIWYETYKEITQIKWKI